MPLPSTPLTLRAVFRRQLEQLRTSSRLPRSAPPRRFQSTHPTPTPTPGPKDAAAKPKPAATSDPVPAGTVPVAPLPLWLRLGPLTRTGQAYARAQRRRPWATQVVTSLFIYLAADLSAQRIGGKDYVPERTARNLVVGVVFAVPNYLWFVWLSRNFNYASHAVSIGVKIVIQQLVFTTVFSTYFFGFQALLAGDSLPEAWDRVRRTVPTSWVNAMKLWPAVTAFSFTFVPMEYRGVFAGVVSVGWQTYLSYLNRRAEIEEEASHGKPAALPAPTEKTPVQIDAQKHRVAA
ncbi:hypothetical protein F4818DRAFT_416602 [Hypoxylon cercidicola]|nr:hypothetical protein F4818DRAFT_416602 [Hypoxylon cercidicola]